MEWIRKPFDQLSAMELFRILQGRSEVFVVEQECIYLDPDDIDPLCEHLFALQDGELAGCCRIVPKGARYAADMSIGRIIIMPKFRRQGLAREMLQLAIRYIADTLGETTIRISAQCYIRGFYERLGFAACSGEYLEDGIPHVEMLWSAAEPSRQEGTR